MLEVLCFHQLIVLLEDTQYAFKFLDPNLQFLFSNHQCLVVHLDILRILGHLSLRSLLHVLHLDPADELPLFRHPLDLIAHLTDLTHPVLEHTLV